MKEKNIFTSRLNTDKEERTLDPGEYRSASHARIGTSSVGNVNAAESIATNLLRSAGYSFPAGLNKCIGTCQDVKNNAIIYCIYNSNQDHRIIRYFVADQSIEDILIPSWDVSVLNWQYTPGFRLGQKRLWNLRIVETGNSQLMFFTDAYNQPRRINLNLKASRGTGAYVLTENDISVAREPDTFVSCSFLSDPLTPSDFINNNWFQFRVRYVWENEEQSSWSPLSSLLINTTGVNYNAINVTTNSGPQGVVKIEFAVRQGNGVSSTGATNTELYIFKTWTKGSYADDTNITIPFYNSEVLTPVSRISSDTNFYQVPQVAGCQEIVQSNQVIYGDITEGYDNLTIPEADMPVLENEYEQTTIKEFRITGTSIDVPIGYVPTPNQQVSILIGTETSYIKYSFISIATTSINFRNEIVNYLDGLNGYTATISAGLIVTNISNLLKVYSYKYDYIVSNPLLEYNKLVSQTCAGPGGYFPISFELVNYNGINRISDTEFELQGNIYGTVFIDINLQLRANSGVSGYVNVLLMDYTNPLAPIPIIFRPVFIDDTATFTPITASIDANSLVGKKLRVAVEPTPVAVAYVDGGVFTMELKTPEYLKTGFKSGATHKFGIVYYDDYLRQTGVQAISSIYIDSPAQRAYGLPYNYTGPADDQTGYIPEINWTIKHRPPLMAKYYKWVYNESNISNFCQFIANVKDPNVGANVGYNFLTITTQSLALYPYIFKDITVGDKIRIILTKGINILGVEVNTYIESTILSVTATELTVDTSNGLINTQNINGALVEVYVTNNSALYYEFPEIYEIGNPGTGTQYHKGGTQNQTPDLLTPAKGDFIGTTYFYINNEVLGSGTSPNTTAFTENANIDNNFESNFWSKGRAQIETPMQARRRTAWMIRWGGKLFQDTQINDMSNFESGQYKILSARFAGITGLREVGYTLKIIQETNYSTAFLGRNELQESGGAVQQVIITDNLIGTINSSEYGYGTKYPGSICSYGNHVYWFDTTKGEVIREAGNAPFAISKYGMIKYFRDAAQTIVDGGYEIITGFNKQEESLYLTWFTDEYSVPLEYLSASIFTLDPLKINIDTTPQLATGTKLRIEQGLTSFLCVVDSFFLGQYTCTLIAGIPTLDDITNIYTEGENQQETITFFDPERESVQPGWTTNLDMTKTIGGIKVPVDMYGWIGRIFTASLNANIYESNAVEGSYLNLFGEDKVFKIQSIFNDNPDQMKVFLAHAVHANTSFDQTIITIPPSQNYPNGMRSILKEGNYKMREGGYYAEIKKDGYTKGFTADNTVQFINGLINGRPMRGRFVEVEIIYQGNDIFVLFSHEVDEQYSPLS